MGLALRVEPNHTPTGVARRLFGMTKLLSSRLVWRVVRLNRTVQVIENGP